MDLASARESLCRRLGSRWFTERFHRNAPVTHFQHGQVFCTARPEWATRPDEEETKRSSLSGNFNFVYFKTVVGMLDGISECILFHVLIIQIVFI